MGISDRECAALLEFAASRLSLRPEGFARVRKQVRKRIARRLAELSLPDAAAYRARLEADPAEWDQLDRLCRVTISRFWRDAPAFDALATRVLPELAARARDRGARIFRVWSLACASGEEPHSVALAWHVRLAARFPDLTLQVLATDASPELLERARRAEYARSIFRELPSDLIAALPSGGTVVVPAHLRAGVQLVAADVRDFVPRVAFDAVLCRNLVFTYFEPALQLALSSRMAALTVAGGALMIGKRESLPEQPDWHPSPHGPGFFSRRPWP